MPAKLRIDPSSRSFCGNKRNTPARDATRTRHNLVAAIVVSDGLTGGGGLSHRLAADPVGRQRSASVPPARANRRHNQHGDQRENAEQKAKHQPAKKAAPPRLRCQPSHDSRANPEHPNHHNPHALNPPQGCRMRAPASRQDCCADESSLTAKFTLDSNIR